MSAQHGDVTVTSVLAPFTHFLIEHLGQGDKISIFPLWLREDAGLERDWPLVLEYAVAITAESHSAWIAAADASVFICRGETSNWAAESVADVLKWTSTPTDVDSRVATITDARVRRLKASDLLPPHRNKAFAGLVLVFTIGIRPFGDASARPKEIVVSFEKKSPQPGEPILEEITVSDNKHVHEDRGRINQ